MKAKVCIVDTNIIVAGLISTGSHSPPGRILDAMLDGNLIYLMSPELLYEYAAVLQRPRVSRQHGLTSSEIDIILAELVANAIWREPVITSVAPDPGDNHLWALLLLEPGSQLVTGDQLLLECPPDEASVISARNFVDLFLAPEPSR